MSRKLIINIHLYLAAFLAPVLLLMGSSAALYLFGFKGFVEQQEVYTTEIGGYDFKAKDRAAEMTRFLTAAGIEHEFEYVQGGGQRMFTRPTSREHYLVQQNDEKISVIRRTPNLSATLIELHKGHGPIAFRWVLKITAICLLFIVLSGLWLGLTSPLLKKKSIALSVSGLVIFSLLALL